MKSIRVNPIACDGRGLCAELFPERIVLDDWGYPIVDETPIPPSLEHHARRAVTMCPTLALALTESDERANTAVVRGPPSHR
jgi:ferredoxin